MCWWYVRLEHPQQIVNGPPMTAADPWRRSALTPNLARGFDR